MGDLRKSRKIQLAKAGILLSADTMKEELDLLTALHKPILDGLGAMIETKETERKAVSKIIYDYKRIIGLTETETKDMEEETLKFWTIYDKFKYIIEAYGQIETAIKKGNERAVSNAAKRAKTGWNRENENLNKFNG